MDREFESSFPVLTHDKIPMLNANLEPHITITVRHEQATAFLKEYATSKIEGLHLDYPKIIESKAILDVQGKRHTAEILLFCANHITIDASSETEDMSKSIDETIDKIARSSSSRTPGEMSSRLSTSGGRTASTPSWN